MNYKKVFFYSFLIWLIPFILSFPFFTREGVLIIDRTFFSVIMTLSLIIVFCFFLYRYLNKIKDGPEKKILYFGFSAFIVSIFLDLIFLVGIFNMTSEEFLKWTFPSYLNILIISFLVSKIFHLKKSPNP